MSPPVLMALVPLYSAVFCWGSLCFLPGLCFSVAFSVVSLWLLGGFFFWFLCEFFCGFTGFSVSSVFYCGFSVVSLWFSSVFVGSTVVSRVLSIVVSVFLPWFLSPLWSH